MIILVLAVWAFNVAFVAAHELGHVAMAQSSGAKICNIYVSPIGYNGATSFTTLAGNKDTNYVFAGGLISTTLATLLLYMLGFRLGVFIVGLRTIESLLNLTEGSDMALLISFTGPWVCLAGLILAGVIAICVVHSVILGLEKYVTRPVRRDIV